MTTALMGATKTVQLADGPHEVRFTIRSFIKLEEQFDTLGGIDEALKKRPFTATRALLWVGLGCDRSLEAVADLMDGAEFGPLVETLSAAVGEAVGSGADDGTGAGPTQATAANGSTGPSSSP